MYSAKNTQALQFRGNFSVASSLGDLTQSVRPAMPDLRDKSEVSGLRTKLNRTKTEVQSLATRSRSP